MEIFGWGRYPTVLADVIEPVDADSIASLLPQYRRELPLIPRGAGRSYGDSAIGQHVLSSRYLDNFISFDGENGELGAGAGVTLDQILRLSVPKGWFLPVLPGTRHVTLAGAIASDIHGKNHHLYGCFSKFVKSVTLMLASGEIVKCSNGKRKSLFRATCGGMGLTGIILDATLWLEKIDSAFIRQQTITAKSLDEIFTLFEENSQSRYSVAWLDCLATGNSLGRSLLFLGEHESEGKLEVQHKRSLSVPFNSPSGLMNRYSIRLFNKLYYQLGKQGRTTSRPHYEKFFFPLDGIRHWNRLYGKDGFLQYQFVMPTETAREGIAAVLKEVSQKGKGSFLSVLKKMGQKNENFLSFPVQGYTLALDFKFEKSLLPFLEYLDELVLAHDGRLYLTKDARMSELTFKKSYPDWEKFLKIKERADPEGIFASAQSRRLGLTS